MIGSVVSTGIFKNLATQKSLQQKCCVLCSTSFLLYPFLPPPINKIFPIPEHTTFSDPGNSCITYKWPILFFNQNPLAGRLVWLQSYKNILGTFHHSVYLTSQAHWTLSWIFFPSDVSTDVTVLIFVLQT